MSSQYEALLQRLWKGMGSVEPRSKTTRLELPSPDVIWVGNKTIFRNFAEFPKALRRNANHLLMFLAKELATAASLDGDRAIFIGRRARESFSALISSYMKDAVICPVCGGPDTHINRVKRLQFLVCEACGARSSMKLK